MPNVFRNFQDVSKYKLALNIHGYRMIQDFDISIINLLKIEYIRFLPL